MVQTIIVDSKSYDLTKETLSIAKQIEELQESIYNNAISTEDKYSSMMRVIEACVGQDEMLEILETDDVYKVDINLVEIIFSDIQHAYKRPIIESSNSRALKIIDNEMLAKLTTITKGIETMQGNKFYGKKKR